MLNVESIIVSKMMSHCEGTVQMTEVHVIIYILYVLLLCILSD